MAAFALGGLLGPGAATAQDGEAGPTPTVAGAPTLLAESLGEVELNLDGRLTEASWEGAVPITDFTQQEPTEGVVPSERTEVRVLYDQDHLYIGAILFDDPDGILAYQKRRDAGLGTDDRFMWVLDTFLDGRTGYFFEINAQGLMGDGLISGGGGGGGGGRGRGGGGGGMNKSWDGIWEARVARRPDGWSAEIAIPFRTLNFDPELDTWGINFQRTIRRRNEEILWRGHRRNQGLFRLIHAGRVTGLRGSSQGVGLEVTPYAVGGWRTQRADDAPPEYATSWPRDVGFDVGYSITPSLRAAVSVNTDFAEVEVDDRRVNLTRFPQRFPERRDFFLEGSGVFSFGGRSGASPYFSRRIGLVGGEQIGVRYGARLGGQAGPYELGFLQVGTGAEVEVGSETFSVARVKRRILEQSTVGAIYTRRATAALPTGPAGVPDRHTVGVDLDFATSTLFGDKNMDAEAFFVWNSDAERETERSLGDLTARGFRFAFPNDVWSGHLSYREFGHGYDPAVGFVTRNGFRRVEPRIGWAPRPSIGWLRQLDFSGQFRYLADLETGRMEERQWQFTVLGLDFESGDNVNLQLTHTSEYLDRDFEVSDGIVITPGAYSEREWQVRGRTAGRRRVSLNGDIGGGGFWNGDRLQSQAGITVRPQPGYSVGASYEWNRVELPQGSFTTNLVQLDGAWDVSPWASVSGNVQYDDVSGVVGMFLRAHWIRTPGNDLYLVYTQNWQELGPDLLDPRDRGFVTLSRGGSVKLSYTYRY